MSEKTKKILLIENDPYLGTTLVWALASGLGDNAVIEISNTSDEALIILTKQKFDLVISEHHMPRISCLELLTKIREIQPEISAILISDFGPDILDKEIHELIDGFISKPFGLEKLFELVKETLGNVNNKKSSNGSTSQRLPANTPSNYSPTHKKNGPNNHNANTKSESAGRILIMEDDPGLRRIYKKALSRSKYKVFEADTLQMGRDLLDTHTFDIFICDIHLGRERGTDLLIEKSEQLLKNGTQVIMCSSYGQYRYLTQEMGADFFLEKPISIGTLLTLITRLMDNKPIITANPTGTNGNPQNKEKSITANLPAGLETSSLCQSN